MLANRADLVARLMGRPAPQPPRPRVAFYSFQSPLGYPVVTATAVEMVDRLAKERAFCVAEERRGRGCPAPFASWAAVYAFIDGAAAKLEGVDGGR